MPERRVSRWNLISFEKLPHIYYSVYFPKTFSLGHPNEMRETVRVIGKWKLHVLSDLCNAIIKKRASRASRALSKSQRDSLPVSWQRDSRLELNDRGEKGGGEERVGRRGSERREEKVRSKEKSEALTLGGRDDYARFQAPALVSWVAAGSADPRHPWRSSS